MPHLDGRPEALEELGWTGAAAEWLTLVCLHSGVFTRAQYCYRFGAGPSTAHRFVRRLVEAGIAAERTHSKLRTSARLCHVVGRGLYRALGVEDIRHRRRSSEAVVLRRLLSLDFVLERPELSWLPTEHEKVAAFEALGIEADTMPQRVYVGAVGSSRRYFYLKLPVAVGGGQAIFVYADPGITEAARQLDHWGAMHTSLWSQLRGAGLAVHVAVVTRSWPSMALYETSLGKWMGAPEGKPLDAAEQQLLDTILAAMQARDFAALETWGGFTPAAKIAAPLRRRAAAVEGGGGRIDSFETHLAVRITDDAFGALA